MTAHPSFPPAAPQSVPAPPDRDDAETHLAATALRLWQGGAAAQADVATRLRAAFGTDPGNAVAAALDRVWAALRDAPQLPDPDTVAHLVAATRNETDPDDTARRMALGIVPAHRMERLVIAARDLALALRRAVLIAAGPVTCPARQR